MTRRNFLRGSVLLIGGAAAAAVVPSVRREPDYREVATQLAVVARAAHRAAESIGKMVLALEEHGAGIAAEFRGDQLVGVSVVAQPLQDTRII